MIKITNKQKGPIQLIVRSKRSPHSFTTLNIPGIGQKHNVYELEDERMTPYIERIEQLGLIKTKKI
jgi:hypothetical protein